MSTPISPRKRHPLLPVALVALVLVAFALGVLWQSRSKPEPAKSEPDLTSIRESLHAEAAKRLDTPLESNTITVTLKPGTLAQAQRTLREFSCLPLGDSSPESRWLFQGTLEESKRLVQNLEPLGVLESTGDDRPATGTFLMNITLIGGEA